MSKNNMNPYEGLANGIILQAVRDYRDANKKLLKKKNDQNALRMKAECLRFFRSAWYRVLTDVDAEFLIRRLDAEVGYDG